MRKAMKILLLTLTLLLVLIWHFRLPYAKEIKYKGYRAFVMVYSVKHRSDLNAEFVIITKVRDEITVEIIRGAGIENVSRLEGVKAKQYLIDADLDYGE